MRAVQRVLGRGPPPASAVRLVRARVPPAVRAMRLGDRIAVMRDGRIVQNGTAEDILLRPA
ncbi:hypothetical protein, partial [Streptomyces sp. NPDC003487]